MSITLEEDIKLLESVLKEQAELLDEMRAKLAAETDRCVAAMKRACHVCAGVSDGNDCYCDAQEAAMREGK